MQKMVFMQWGFLENTYLVEKMTVKEFLQSVRNQDELLRAYEQELEDLRRRAYSNIQSATGG